MTQPRDAEFADFVATREASLRRLAILLCQDWHRADDLVQAAITKLYVHWPKARAADNIDAYVRAIVIREFLDERRSSWIRRVTLTSQLPDRSAAAPDPETATGPASRDRGLAAAPARHARPAVLLRPAGRAGSSGPGLHAGDRQEPDRQSPHVAAHRTSTRQPTQHNPARLP